MEIIKCIIRNCDRPRRGNKEGYCSKHYVRFRVTGDPMKTPSGKEWGKRNVCKIDGCDDVVEGRGYCVNHYRNFIRNGNPLIQRPKHKDRISVGKYVNKEGYICVYQPNWPSSRKGGWILEHRFVMERKIGRVLFRDEVVHHKNGIRSDNRLRNLEILKISSHYKGHKKSNITCPNCHIIIEI